MKKTILFLAAALALAACTKTAEIPEGTSEGKALKFRLAVNTPTKGDAFDGSDASSIPSGNIQVLASIHKADGSVFQESIFGNQAGYFYKDNTEWVLSKDDNGNDKFLYLPSGTHMNLVAIAGTEFIYTGQSYYKNEYSEYDDYLVNTPYYIQSDWRLTGYKDYKSIDEYVTFDFVDTKKAQNDLMYAIENDIVNGETRTVTLKHAQALINVNIKIDGKVPSGIEGIALAFVGGNVDLQSKMNESSDSYSTMKDYLLNGPSSDVMSNLEDIASNANRFSDMDALFPLKTIGSFIIDSRKNTPVVKWYFPPIQKVLKDHASFYKNAILENKQTKLDLNPEVSSSGYITTISSLFNNSGSSYSGEYRQVAGQLIPEQKIVNPWLFLKINDAPYAMEVNLPKGTWQAGHVYTYNLTISFAGPKFNVVVEDYASPFHSEDVSTI